MKKDMAAFAKQSRNPIDDGATISEMTLGRKTSMVAPVQTRSSI